MGNSADTERRPIHDDREDARLYGAQTASGEAKKLLATVGGGAMGLLNGVFWGLVIAVPAVMVLPFASVGAGVMMCVGLTAAYKGIQGARSGYYDVQSNYQKPERKRHGGREDTRSDEAIATAAEKVEKEMPKSTAAEMQEMELEKHEHEMTSNDSPNLEKESFHHRNKVDASRMPSSQRSR